LDNRNEALAAPLELDEILAELDRQEHKVPTTAILAARVRREEMIPLLIQALRNASARALAGDVPEGNLHWLALYLLAEFQAREALPAIIEALSLPGDLPYDLFVDALSEDLPAILADLAGDQLELIDGLIRDPAIDYVVRWSGAAAYKYLVRDGRITREQAVRRLDEHLASTFSEHNYEITTGLVCELNGLAPREAAGTIAEAFDRDLVEEGFFSREDIEESSHAGEARFAEELSRLRPSGIPDVIALMEGWSCFQPAPAQAPTPRSGLPRQLLDNDFDGDFEDDLEDDDVVGNAGPTERLGPGHDVGRNEPCPCGSGKKYKKCCGAQRS